MDEQSALVFLRGQGEASWVSHHADDARLVQTPAGLECALRDGWHECRRQGRRGILLLCADEARRGQGMAQLERVAAARGTPLRLIDRAADLAGGSSVEEQVRESAARPDGPPILVDGDLHEDALAEALAPLCLELQLWPRPQEHDRERSPTAAEGDELLTIPAGSFSMGSPANEEGRWSDEGPLREVSVASFRLGRHPVTNAAFGRFLRARPAEELPAYWSDARFNAPGQPAVGVGFAQAARYAAWAGGRLPSEAEWEYACRAGTRGPRYGALDEIAWHAGNSGARLHPVGGLQPNAFGLADMLGNAWEWVADDRHDSYAGGPSDATAWIGPPAPVPPRRLLRGGSWADSPRTVRAATRLTDHPGPRIGNIGLRLAADLAP